MAPRCRDCRYCDQWSGRCSQPDLVRKYGVISIITARDLDEACGADGKLWEKRLGFFSAILTKIFVTDREK